MPAIESDLGPTSLAETVVPASGGRASPSRGRFARASWLLTGYTVVVILWGALVRATGAGAGCGSHWPLCNGEVLPRAAAADTLIELSHRASSGVLGLLVLALAGFAFRSYPRGHAVRKGAVATLVFVLTEVLIGAGLVRFEWVASDDSVERVYVMAFHLVNTFVLLGALTLTAWHASEQRVVRPFGRGRGEAVVLLGAAVVSLLAVGSSGAVTALGDTLVLTAGLSPAESPTVSRLVAGRFYHPSLAVFAFLVVSGTVLRLGSRSGGEARRASRSIGRAVIALFALQLGLGALNVYLQAPVWMQLVHLGLSDVLWIAFVVFGATVLEHRR